MKEIIINNEKIKEEILYFLSKQKQEEVKEITDENVKSLNSLKLSFIKNDDYGFLKYFTNLKEIEIEGCSLKSIDFLKVLPNLENIIIYDNLIKDISILSTFKNLKEIDMRYNAISDIDVLSNLKNLKVVKLRNNPIKNLEPIKNLDLEELCICGMKLDKESCDIVSSYENLEIICGHDAKVKGNIKLSKNIKEAYFYDMDSSNIDFSLIKNAVIIQAPTGKTLIDFSHMDKILNIHLNDIDLEKDFELLRQFVYEKDLQFLHIENLSFEQYENLSNFRSLKITTSNEEITNYILLNNKMINWYYNSFDDKVIDKVFCEEYLDHFLYFIYKKEKNGFVMHMQYLKKLYLSIFLAYDEDYDNYISFSNITRLYEHYMSKNKNTMTAYQRAKFKEFYAFLISKRVFQSLEEENTTIIDCLKESLEDYESEYIYYKIIYLYLQINDYENAAKWFDKIPNSFGYNYFVAYYNAVISNKFDNKSTSLINIIEKLLNNWNFLTNIEIELIYNYVLLEYSNINKSINLSYDTVESILDKQEINIMFRNKLYEVINSKLKGKVNIDKFYNDLMKKEDVKAVVNRYDEGIEKVINGEATIKDIIQFGILKRGHWEEESPI